MIQRMNRADARAKGERRLLKPALQRRLRLIFDNPRGERLGPEGKKISQARGAPGQLDFAAERLRREIEGRINNQTARRNERALAQIKCLSKTERIYEIGGLAQKFILDRSTRDFDVPGGENHTGLVLFRELARELDTIADLELGITIVIEGQRRQLVLEAEIGVEEEWVLVNDFAFVTAL